MPRSSCNYCCNPGELARSIDTYRAAHLGILCNLLDAFTGGEVAAVVQSSQIAATMPAATAMQTAAVANGNGTILTVLGYATAILQVKSSVAMSGGTTVNFEVSADAGVTWVPISGHQVGDKGSLVNTVTFDGDFRFNVAGFSQLRARISAYSAGTVTITGYVTPLAAHPTTLSLAEGPLVTRSSSNGTPVTTATNTIAVAAPAAGNHLRVHRLQVANSSATATWIYWRDGVAGALRYPAYLPQNGFVSLKFDSNDLWDLTSATALYLNTATAGANVEWHVDSDTVPN